MTPRFYVLLFIYSQGVVLLAIGDAEYPLFWYEEPMHVNTICPHRRYAMKRMTVMLALTTLAALAASPGRPSAARVARRPAARLGPAARRAASSGQAKAAAGAEQEARPG